MKTLVKSILAASLIAFSGAASAGIIDFAEIGDFIDAPVQTYSSGMVVRLGFSVAATLDPELLLIDEVLSVGDSSFRERCYHRLNQHRRKGGSVIFVSHNSLAVEAISDRVMLLDHGEVSDVGEPTGVVQRYEQAMLELSRQADLRLAETYKTTDALEINQQDTIWFTEVQCYDLSGNQKSEFEFGEPFEVRLRYQSNAPLHKADFILAIRKGSSLAPIVSAMHTVWDGVSLEDIPKQGVVACIVESPPYTPGYYEFHVGVQSGVTGQLGPKWYARPQDLGWFRVLPNELRTQLPGVPAASLVDGMPPVAVAHSWKLNGRAVSMSGRSQSS